MRIPLDTLMAADDVQVASPCTADWDRMEGDDRVRFCPQCRQQVFNLSAMTAEQCAALLRKKDGMPCVRFYRRRDGTVMTADCPVGIQRLAHFPWRWAAILLAAAFPLVTAVVAWSCRPRAYMGGLTSTPLSRPSTKAGPAAEEQAGEHPPHGDNADHPGNPKR